MTEHPFAGRGKTGFFLCLIPILLLCATAFSADPAPKIERKSVPAAQKIPLKVMNLPDPKATDPLNKAKLAVYQAFNRKYPEVELSAFSGIELEGMGRESKLMLSVVGGSAPDIIYVNFRMSDTYIQHKILYPLDEFIRKTYGSLDAYTQTIPEAIRPVIRRDGPKVRTIPAGDHVWCLPEGILVRALVWRKDLFQKAGLNPEHAPENWDELYSFAKRLTDPSRNEYGLELGTGPQAAWDFMAFLWSAGGDAVVRKNGEWTAVYDSREAANALSFYTRLVTERWLDADGREQFGYTSASLTETQRKDSQLQIAMRVNYLDDRQMGGGLDPALLGIAPFPAGPTGKRGTEINSRMNGIFAGITGRSNKAGVYVPAEKIREAAWHLIDFLSSKEARRIIAETYIENGLGRYLSPLWLKEFGYDEYLNYFPKAWEQAFYDAIRDGKPEPYGRNCQMVYLYMTKPMDEAVEAATRGTLPSDPEQQEKRLDILQGFLRNAVAATNQHMIGKIAPEERVRRNRIAIFAAMLITALFCFVLYKIWQVFSPKDIISGKSKGLNLRRNWIGYLIMLPALLNILMWSYYPMFSGSQLLFQDYQIEGAPVWTGFRNLADVLFSAEWWSSVWNTFRYMALILGFGFVAPILLALLLQEVSHCKLLYRTLYYLPAVMSGLVVIYMWKLFYQSGPTGLLNQVIASLCSLFGFTPRPVAWLQDSSWAMLSCVLPTIWASVGPGCLIYLAALKGIPDDIYEAAEIDGANFFQKIIHVTLPSLKALILINFVGAFIAAANSGGMILVMTFGRANTEVAELHIFKEAYTNLNFGAAIAMAWILGTMTLLFTLYQLKKLSNMEFKTAGK